MSKSTVEKGIVTGQQVQYRAVVGHRIGKEQDRFSIKVASDLGELREVAFAFLVERIEVPNMQPHGPKFDGHPLRFGVLEHPPSLSSERLGLRELTRTSQVHERIVGHRSPQKIAQAIGELEIGDVRRLVGPLLGTLDAVEELRGNQNSSHQKLDCLLVGCFGVAKILVKVQKRLTLRVAQRLSICTLRKLQYRFDVLGLRIEHGLSELGGFTEKRFPQWLKGARVGVLSCKLPKLLIGIDGLECVLADKMELCPEFFQCCGLLLIEHQLAQILVLAIEQSQGNDFVDRNNFVVAQCDRE